MRVGFLTTVLWQRYGPPWAAMVADLGAEVVLPDPEAVVQALDDPRAATAPSLLPRLCLAALAACGPCDLVVAPSLVDLEDGGPGSAQDPWIASLPEALERATPGAAAVLGVPGEGGPAVERAVMPALTRIHRDVGLARRAWERRRAALSRPLPRRPASPRVLDPGGRRVALVAHPWWLTPGGVELAGRGAGTVVGQHLLEPGEAREEGLRARADLVAPDAEAVGAARRFGRQGDVDVVRLLVDPDAPTSGWLERRVREVAGRKLEVVALTELGDARAWARALATRDA